LEAIACRRSANTELEVVPQEAARFASSMNQTFGLPNFKVFGVDVFVSVCGVCLFVYWCVGVVCWCGVWVGGVCVLV
jgi:hypothetical protein